MKRNILFFLFLTSIQLNYFSQSTSNNETESRVYQNKINNLNTDEGFVYETTVNLVPTKKIKSSKRIQLLTEFFNSIHSAEVLKISSKRNENITVYLNFYQKVNIAQLKEDIYSYGFIITDVYQHKKIK